AKKSPQSGADAVAPLRLPLDDRRCISGIQAKYKRNTSGTQATAAVREPGSTSTGGANVTPAGDKLSAISLPWFDNSSDGLASPICCRFLVTNHPWLTSSPLEPSCVGMA